jgi:hypothetical protein
MDQFNQVAVTLAILRNLNPIQQIKRPPDIHHRRVPHRYGRGLVAHLTILL